MQWPRLTDALRQQISANVESFPHREIAASGLRPAAVALVIAGDSAGVPVILLTKRPQGLGRHPGQYALPGGRVDPGETSADAALRELDEELGLSLAPHAIVGQLDDYPTRSGFRITPFVVWAGNDAPLSPSPDEVAEVFRIPFDELDSNAIPLFQTGETPARPILYSNFASVGTTMFSPTAAIIYQFREVALRNTPTRVAHYDQPKFAWR